MNGRLNGSGAKHYNVLASRLKRQSVDCAGTNWSPRFVGETFLHGLDIGTLGILLAAKRRGFLPAIRPYLGTLLNFGFHIAPDLYDLVLVDAGEEGD
jgi:hypothetical protein